MPYTTVKCNAIKKIKGIWTFFTVENWQRSLSSLYFSWLYSQFCIMSYIRIWWMKSNFWFFDLFSGEPLSSVSYNKSMTFLLYTAPDGIRALCKHEYLHIWTEIWEAVMLLSARAPESNSFKRWGQFPAGAVHVQ